jgi:hypothetical protein
VTNAQIFRIDKQDLREFFNPKQHKLPDNVGECRNTLNMLRECGYVHGLCRLLGSDFKTGIIGDKPDIERRQAVFGKHTIALPQIQTFMTILYQQFEESMVIYMTWVATLYLFFSFFGSAEDGNGQGYIESLTIYFGLMFACLLAALCDWIKQKQHLKIKD